MRDRAAALAAFAALAALLAIPVAAFAAAPSASTTPTPPSSSSATAIKSPHDSASGQATGKRQHKPIRARMYYDQTVPLKGGRVFLLNSKTGEVEFGDGAHGKAPEPAGVPPNGTYFLPDGTPCHVKGGRLVKTAPPPTKTPLKGGGAVGNIPK